MMIDYLQMIQRVFNENCIIECIDNYDDIYCGWNIMPNTRILIRFMVKIHDEANIKIIKYKIALGFDNHTVEHIIFNGDMPTNEEHNFDLGFIEKILKNYEKFS